VGNDTTPSGLQTLAESWDGTAWSVLTTPDPVSTAELDGVSCVSSTDCVAVGTETDGTTVAQTLVEAFNGTSWTVVPSPDPSNYESVLIAVSCTSSTNCVAVGSSLQGGTPQTLIESFDGTSWSVDPSPNQGSASDDLFGVSCFSSTSCMAVGDYIDGSPLDQSLTESFDGTSWAVVPSPDSGNSSNFLNGVSCSTSVRCMAVGQFLGAAGKDRTLTESWNGSAWTIAASADRGKGSNDLEGVSCDGAKDCVAVGDSRTAANVTQTLVESFNGKKWSLTGTPNNGTGDNELNAATDTSTTSAEAVGYSVNTMDQDQTLVETGGPAALSEGTSRRHP
jgi:hypothetical protein